MSLLQHDEAEDLIMLYDELAFCYKKILAATPQEDEQRRNELFGLYVLYRKHGMEASEKLKKREGSDIKKMDIIQDKKLDEEVTSEEEIGTNGLQIGPDPYMISSHESDEMKLVHSMARKKKIKERVERR